MQKNRGFMLNAEQFLSPLKKRGFNFFTGTPCSYLKPFINSVIDSPELDYIDSVNEGDAIAIAAGAYTAGKLPVVMFQNSGLGNAVNPLSSLNYIFKIPVLGITTLRGEPGGAPDEPQHKLMGEITPQILDLLEIPWLYFPQEENQIEGVLDQATKYLQEYKTPFFLIMRKDDIKPYDVKAVAKRKNLSQSLQHSDHFTLDPTDRVGRTEALKTVQEISKNSEVAVVTTTGMTGRELYELGNHSNQFYMVGSMGCALAFGIGLSIAKPNLKVVIIDGDGALLMRTGSMATAGYYAPTNLLHILLDNEVHDSTGGQSTVSGNISFAAVAKGFGYKNAYSSDKLENFKEVLSVALDKGSDGPIFFHMKIKKGSPAGIGRPKEKPEHLFEKFRQYVQSI
jgi:phosphonopyruvate decarboxylase